MQKQLHMHLLYVFIMPTFNKKNINFELLKCCLSMRSFCIFVLLLSSFLYESYVYANDAERAVNRGQSSEFQNGEPQQG